MSKDPRQSNGHRRRQAARRFAAANLECALCHGAMGPIDYAAPRNHEFPLSLAIDEIAPVSRWREFGYGSAKECATDPSNWQPSHWICNSRASNKKKSESVLADTEKARRERANRDTGSGAF